MPKVVPYKRGSIIFFEGDKDDRIFILQTGSVSLTTKDLITSAEQVEQLQVGEFFGVKSAIAHKPRMETATVLADSNVVQLTVQEFDKIFGKNINVVGKMLHVFSKNLRDLHKQALTLLKTEEATLDPEEGLLKVIESFASIEEYHSASSVCSIFLKRFPNSSKSAEVTALEEKYKKSAENEVPYTPPSLTESDEKKQIVSEATLKHFSLPVFDRFTKTFESGEVIISEYEPGDNFYLIKSGDVQIVKCANGKKKNLDILHQGEFFGEMAILDDSPRSATCLARGQVQCLEFNKENFQALVLGNSIIVMNLLRLFCKRIYDQQRGIHILTISDIQARLADIFLMYAESSPANEASDNDPYNSKRKFNLTVSDIAQWAGISADTARDELNKFVSKSKLEIYDNYMVVININDMKRTVDQYFSNLENAALKPKPIVRQGLQNQQQTSNANAEKSENAPKEEVPKEDNKDGSPAQENAPKKEASSDTENS